ncbi:MAG: type II toxin-antitoxin system RelE/ParE family toxin [Bacteroidales bacterium]|nr:type II toxin-antitoxin system RelE/ParE family toxin [Bacteroidales bacterium]MCF8458738.1 type II toxin-antitoxin system RelE/ParE family toxin [Bacteroidales bacterium]
MEIKIEKVVISRRARNSIDEIYSYVKDRSKSIETAHYVRKTILDKCLSLKHFSGYSKEPYLEEFPEDYRSVSIWSYVIIYVVRKNMVSVLNVVHGKQDPEVRKSF